MDSTALAVGIGGVVQPYVRALIARWTGFDPTGQAAYAYTVLASLLIALLATWATGGFAGATIPAFSLADPSALLAFLWPKWTSVYALSHLVFGSTKDTVEKIAG